MCQPLASAAWIAIATLGFIAQTGLAQSVETTAYTGARQDPRPELVHRAKQPAGHALYYSPEAWSQLRAWSAQHPAAGRQAFAVIDTAATETDIATQQSSKPRFGFSGAEAAQSPDGWFYDYFTYSPTFYAAPNSDASLYRQAIRYYDLDNDGVYDRLSRFWDSDYNGSYDAHERIDFAAFRDDSHQAHATDEHHGAIQYTVNGTIEATKIVAVNAVGHLIVRVSDLQSVVGAEINTDVQTVIDLGPTARWRGQPLKVGEQMTVTGVIERLGNKQVLIAETATVGSQKQIVIRRGPPALDGQIVDLTTVEVDGAQHAFAILRTDSTGHIVDLGPADGLVPSPETGTNVSIQGMPVRVHGHSLIFADRVYWNGQEVAVQRW